MKRVTIGALCAGLVMAVVACEPQPPPACGALTMPPCGVEAPAPDANGVLVVGDSITWTAYLAGPIGYPFHGYAGWRAGHPIDHVAHTLPRRLVVALGVNDANVDGWTQGDQDYWALLLALSEDPVVVLPAVSPWANPTLRAEVDKARAWIVAQGVKWVDWQDQANDPAITGPDGIHLAPGPLGLAGISQAGRDARVAVIAEAAEVP